MDWQPDRELRVRMVIVLGSLAALFVGFLFALHWIVTDALSWVLSALFSDRIVVGTGAGVAVVAVLVSLALAAEFLSDDGSGVPPERAAVGVEPLDARVTRLAQQADVSVPRVVVSNADVPNAYTEGLVPGRETIVVTPSLVETLDGDELDAVLAHELAHVKNRDVPVLTAASAVEIVSRWFLDRFEADPDDDRRTNPTDGGDVIVVCFFFFHFLLIQPIAWAFWFVGRALVRILSQHREYAADRGAVAIAGNPGALASALAKLDHATADLPREDLRTRENSRRAFYIVPVPDEPPEGDGFDVYEYTGYGVAGEERSRLVETSESVGEIRTEINQSSSLPTHPPTGERIARLRELRDRL